MMARILFMATLLAIFPAEISAQELRLAMIDNLHAVLILPTVDEIDIGRSNLIEVESLEFLELSTRQRKEISSINDEGRDLLNERMRILSEPESRDSVKEKMEQYEERLKKLQQRIDSVFLPNQKELLDTARLRFRAIIAKSNERNGSIEIEPTDQSNQAEIEKLRRQCCDEVIKILTPQQRANLDQRLGKEYWKFSSNCLEILTLQLEEAILQLSATDSNRPAKTNSVSESPFDDFPKLYQQFFEHENGYNLEINGALSRGSLPFLSVPSRVGDIVKLYDGPELFNYQTNDIDQSLSEDLKVEFRKKSQVLLSKFQSSEILEGELRERVAQLGVEFELAKFKLVLETLPQIIRDEFDVAIERRLITTRGLICYLLSSELTELSVGQKRELRELAVAYKEKWNRMGQKFELDFWSEDRIDLQSLLGIERQPSFQSCLINRSLQPNYSFLALNLGGRIVFPKLTETTGE